MFYDFHEQSFSNQVFLVCLQMKEEYEEKREVALKELRAELEGKHLAEITEILSKHDDEIARLRAADNRWVSNEASFVSVGEAHV